MELRKRGEHMFITNKSKGFTLVELILAIGLIGIVITLSANMITLSTRVHKVTVDEYTLQSSIRLAVDKTNDVVRYSTALFTIPTGRFLESNLTDGWHYFGVSNDGSEIIRYIYEERGGVTDHWKEVVVAAHPNVKYELHFEAVDHAGTGDFGKMLKFAFVAVLQDTNQKRIVIESEVEAVNALQVVDRGTALSPAIALAYRADDRPQNEILGVITMVLDVSGSMNYALGGATSGVATEDRRITKLKNALNGYTKVNGEVVEGMINEFAKEEYIEIAIVPFSTSANYPTTTSASSSQNHPFYKVSDPTQKNNLRTIVSGLNADGGTNTGDGMRRAYFRNKYFKDNITTMPSYGNNFSTRDYMIILVDGVTTMATSNGGTGDSRYRVTDGHVNNLTWNSNINTTSAGIIGHGSQERSDTDRYVELIGAMIKNAGIKVYVIGFSEVNNELLSVNKIATAAGASTPNVYKFTENLDLDEVFKEIKADIMKDLWHVRGPNN